MMAALDILNGFAGKVISDCIDISIDAIRKADKDRKSKSQNMQTRIYQVTIDAINVFTFNTYKEQEKLYDAAESILRGFKSRKENIEAVKTGLKMLDAQITDNRCEDFLGKLCDEVCKDENDILYKEIILIQNRQLNEDVHEGFKRSEQNQNNIREDIHEGFERSEQNNQETQRKLDYLVEKADNKEVNFYSETRVENRAEEYAEKWEKNVFLNNFNERDENAGINIKLQDIYLEEQLPHYIWKKNAKISNDLRKLLTEYVIEKSGRKMLLILGQPGIGKSTLLTWSIIKFKKNKEDFLVYQFASDLKNIDWYGNDILSEILKIIKLDYADLKNKVLILDGFDEIYISGDRKRILNNLNLELKRRNILETFSLIITCRENYIYNLQNIECDYITLQAWDRTQINSFCRTYWQKTGNVISEDKINKILENEEVFGIPLILYMILALNVNIEKNSSKVDIYDQIFSLERGGIYDRCYDIEHRINKTEIKKNIYQISQRIAFWIFENNADKAFIYQKNFKEICEAVISEAKDKNEDIQSDTLIGCYFKIKHCEGKLADEVNFVHRSIYEYFVAVYFFESLYNLDSKEEIAGKLGELLKDGHLSEEILEFIKYKFEKLKGYNLAVVTREIFQIMLQDGMTYHIGVPCKNAMDREMNIFANMLEVIHLWNHELGEFDDKIDSYLQYNRMDNLNLRNIHLKRANLSGADLSGADLSGADIVESNLSRADLSGADLSGANIVGANLSGADLSEADLSGADIVESNLSGADLSGADLSGADIVGVNLSRADLSGTDLSGANIVEVNLSNAIFDENRLKY